MAENLLHPAWKNVDRGELMCILRERIGGHGQYDNPAAKPRFYYVPLASSCQVKLTFSDKKEILTIEPGPAFDSSKWAQVVADIEQTEPLRIGRDCSFTRFPVSGWWRGKRCGVQILPPPAGAPCAPVEMAEHPCILEFPVVASHRWPITNYRRMREHRRMTHLLNILLVGSTTFQPRRSRHLWASVPPGGEIKWVQEFFFAAFGEPVIDALSPPAGEPMTEVESDAYYNDVVGHDGRQLQVPADLDDSICCYQQLSPENVAKFSRACFWMDMALRQWTVSLSAVFASLVIAIDSLADKTKRARERFRNFIEKYAPGAALEGRRNEMYTLRSDILHGDALFEIDLDIYFGWSPLEHNESQLLHELWGLTQIALRNWLRKP